MPLIRENINFCIENLILTSDLKLADITPASKKKSKTSAYNYRPISILPNISKSQVDSPESPEMSEITEMTENFIKVTKNLTKLKETLTNYVWEKSHFKKQQE